MTKTEQMLADLPSDLTCPVDNWSQGKATRVLFVCSAGLLRSPTGAAVATSMGFNARSCGSGVHYALVPISVNLVHWAKHIFFMNGSNFDQACHAFHRDKELQLMMLAKGVILEIEDEFNFMDPVLVSIFRKELGKFTQ